MFSLTIPISSEGGDSSFQNNVPDPVTSGNELPTFKFELEKSEGKVMGGSYGKEATVDQLPISKGIAGVSMRMEPGVMRELHWHATAAEWAFVTEGRVRTTVIDPQGCSETNDFGPGDIWYFPRGHGHVHRDARRRAMPFHSDLRQRLLLRVRHLQHQRLDRARAEGAAREEFRRCRPRPSTAFRRRKSTSPRAQSRPRCRRKPLQGWKPPPLTHKYRMLAQQPYETFKGGTEWRVDGSQFPISTTMTGVVLELEPGALRELHWHPNADEWQYVLSGQFSVTLFGSHGRYRNETLNKGDVGYIPQGFGHSIENIGTRRRAS